MTKEKIFHRILQILLLLTFIAPLIVTPSLLFPFITGKAFYFRFLIDITFCLWLVFILAYPKYLPKLNNLSLSVVIYAAVLFLSFIFSVDHNLSFWGDVERMWGVWSLWHFFLFFIMASSLFREKKDIYLMLNTFLFFSFFVCLYGFAEKAGLKWTISHNQSRITSTFGNSGLLASYLIFGFYFSIFLFFEFERYILKIIYSLLFFTHFLALFFTGTRGAYLGVIISFVAMLLLIIILNKNKKIKYSIAGLLVLFILSYGFLIINSNKKFVKSNSYLYRLTHFSLKDATLNTRLLSWKYGLEGFKNNPLLGTGPENYAIVFDKYFQPIFYNYTSSETYFDRAHNIYIGTLVTTGILGLISYLLIFYFILHYLIKAEIKAKISHNFFIISIGLFTAYTVQNAFIFDNLGSLLGFMVFLTIVQNYTNIDDDYNNKNNTIKPASKHFIYATSAILFILFIVSTNYTIIKPVRAMELSIKAEKLLFESKNSHQAFILIKKSLTKYTVLNRDIRTNLSQVISKAIMNKKFNHQDAVDSLNFIIGEMKKNLAYNPKDSMLNMQQGELYTLKGGLIKDNKSLKIGQRYLEKAIESSPGRVKAYYPLAENKFLLGDTNGAVETMNKAIKLNPNFEQSYWQLIRFYYFLGKDKKVMETMKLAEQNKAGLSVKNLETLAVNFYKKNKLKLSEQIFSKLSKNQPNNYHYYVDLAKIYSRLGEKEKAKKAALTILKLEPRAKNEIDVFIKSLKQH